MAETTQRPVLHAVLPLAVDVESGRDDLARAVTQGRTLRHFFRRDQRLQVNVVGRTHELSQIAEALKPLEAPWLSYAILDEAVVVPGLAQSRISGWHKQQIIKMAALEWLGAPFWLTLDADVICTRPVGIEDLLPGGRALLSVDSVAVAPIFMQWAMATRELLGMAAPPLSLAMAVTPLIYAAPIMRATYETMEAAQDRPWKEILLDDKYTHALGRRYGQAWAENHLYYMVGARLGMLRAFHAFAGIDVPHKLHAQGVWTTGRWQEWDAAAAFDRKQPGIFAVCNSYTGMPAAFVEEKVAPFLRGEPPPPAPMAGVLADQRSEDMEPGPRLRLRLLSRRPLIVQGAFDDAQPHLATFLSRGVLRPWQMEPFLVLLTLPWSHESLETCHRLAARIARRAREAPMHRFVVLCNTEIEVETLRQFGVVAVLVNHNALLDERPFLGDATDEPEFDAVYNAGFHPAKRHQLAAKIESLALIYADPRPLPGQEAYAEETRRALSHAVHLNLDPADGRFRFFSRAQIGAQLQRARVGLCLSPEEGAMRASAEYLFAGLPLVSTFSRGGRDQFFDADFCAVVPPSPDIVAHSVRELIGRRLSRHHIRRRVMHKLTAHRERLMQVVQQAIAALGSPERPRIAWPWQIEERILDVEDFHREALRD